MTPAARHTAVVLAAVLLAGAALAAWVWSQPRLPQPPSGLTLRTLQGESLELGELRGQVTMVAFWATSCEVCLREMPQLVALHQDFANRGFTLVAVAMPYDPAYLVAQYATTRRLPFAVALDLKGEAVQGFGGVTGTPTAFVVARDGRVVERIVGTPDFDWLRARIESELRAPG